MKPTMAVLSSDGVNRQGSLFPTAELVRQLESLYARGIPSLLSHNAHRPVGWTYPRGLFYRNGTTLLLGDVCYPESDDDHEKLGLAYQNEVTRRMEEDGGDAYDRLKAMLGEALGGKERKIFVEGAALVEPGLAQRAFPAVFKRGDKDGLVPLGDLVPISPGVYQSGDLCLFAHPFFRRSLSRLNSLNEELLNELQRLASVEDVAGPSVRLDPDMVGLAETVKRRIELQYWWGPRFSDNLASIPPGVSRHDATERQRLFSGVSATEFWWHSRDGQHTLEAEELLDVESFAPDGTPLFGCRYVHSIVDESSGRIEHLDGAIRGYSDEMMVERLDRAINEAGRRSDYTKLWRLDGTIELSTWKNLIHHHFRDNKLVGEYLSGVDEEDVGQAGVAGERSDPVPFSACSSLSLLLVLRPHSGGPLAAERQLEPGLVVAGRPACSIRIVDLHKLLVRNGQPPLLDGVNDLEFLAHSDMYAELPLVMHSSRDALEGTRRALCDLLGAWKMRTGADTIAAVNVGLRGQDADILLGLLGPVPDVLGWMTRSDWFPKEDALGVWSESAVSASRAVGAGSVHPFHVVAPNYRVEFQRVVVDRAHVQDLEVVDGALVATCAFPPEMRRSAEAFARGELFIRPMFLVRAAECGHCGQQYRMCPHIKMLDEGVSMVIQESEMLELHWTDRPA